MKSIDGNVHKRSTYKFQKFKKYRKNPDLSGLSQGFAGIIRDLSGWVRGHSVKHALGWSQSAGNPP